MINGIHAVLYALFREDEQLDQEAMAKQVDYCIDRNCHGITVLGLATEVQKLSLAERINLISMVADAIDDRCLFSVTVSGNSVAEQVEIVRAAEKCQADWLILQPPMSGSYATEIYLQFFERVISHTSLPVAIQNAPDYLGRSLTANDIVRLQERCDNFVAVKSEESALGVHTVIESGGDKLNVVGGRGGLEMIDLLRLGCKGFVLAPDIAPIAVKIYSAWQLNEVEKAQAIYAQALPTIVFTMQSLEHLIAYGKRVFAYDANLVVHDRAPALIPSEQGLNMASRHAASLKSLFSNFS